MKLVCILIVLSISASQAHDLSWTFYKSSAKDPRKPARTQGTAYLRMGAIKGNFPGNENNGNFQGEVQIKDLKDVTAVFLRLYAGPNRTGRIAVRLWPATGANQRTIDKPMDATKGVTIPFNIPSTKLQAPAGTLTNFISLLESNKVYLSVSTKVLPNSQAEAIRGPCKPDSEMYCKGVPDFLIMLGYVPECESQGP